MELVIEHIYVCNNKYEAFLKHIEFLNRASWRKKWNCLCTKNNYSVACTQWCIISQKDLIFFLQYGITLLVISQFYVGSFQHKLQSYTKISVHEKISKRRAGILLQYGKINKKSKWITKVMSDSYTASLKK